MIRWCCGEANSDERRWLKDPVEIITSTPLVFGWLEAVVDWEVLVPEVLVPVVRGDFHLGASRLFQRSDV